MKNKINFEDILKQLEHSSDKIEGKLMIDIYSIIDLDRQELGVELRQSVCNYTIIRLASIIESYFKNRIRELVDKHDLEVSGIFPKDEISIPLNELDKIKDQKITKGRILAYAVNFQDFNQINKVVSRLLSIDDFNKSLRKYRHTFQFADGEEIEFQLNKIYELFGIRHKIIHELADFKGGFSQLREYLAHTMMLFSGSESTIIDNVVANVLPKK